MGLGVKRVVVAGWFMAHWAAGLGGAECRVPDPRRDERRRQQRPERPVVEGRGEGEGEEEGEGEI